VSGDRVAFPALGFAAIAGKGADPGLERVVTFSNAEDFSTAASWELDHWPRLAMEVADAAGRRWKIVEVVDLGIIGPLWMRALRALLQQSVHRLRLDLIELEPQTLDDVKARVCACIQANPDDWRDDEAIAGEAGPPREEQELLDELKTAVRNAQSVPQIISALYDEHPG
jgi:hypothetical protein